MPCTGRFAPTPSGPLHAGSLVAALGSWLDARHDGGRWLLRIEDIDPPREAPGAAAAILAALPAFGLVADAPPLFQSQRMAAYAAALERLRDAGLAFACWCSRSELAANGGIHRDGHCVARPDPARAPAWRLRVPDTEITFTDILQGPQRQNLRETVGDFVLRRADGLPAYQLACVVDDAHQGIERVVRGIDLLDSTPRQIWLQRCLDLPVPAYLHLPLALDTHGDKLAKSTHAPALDPADPLPALRAALAFLRLPHAAGDVPGLLAAALAAYDPQRLPRHSAPFRA